jgi:hypothetical protein
MILLRNVPPPVAGGITGAFALWFLNAYFAYHDENIMPPYAHTVTKHYLISSVAVTFLAGGAFGALTGAMKRYKRVDCATVMIWKLLIIAQQTFRTLRASELLTKVAPGANYKNGVETANEVPQSYKKAA